MELIYENGAAIRDKMMTNSASVVVLPGMTNMVRIFFDCALCIFVTVQMQKTRRRKPS